MLGSSSWIPYAPQGVKVPDDDDDDDNDDDDVLSRLTKHFTGRWIGCRGPTEWPPRSSDFTAWVMYVFL